MSPEYRSISNVPRDFVCEIKKAFEGLGLDYQSAVHEGFGVCKPDGRITKVVSFGNLSEGVLKAARKSDSPWHVVCGIMGKSKHINSWPEKDEGKRVEGGGRSHGHRGKHRSVTKGSGVRSFLNGRHSTKENKFH